jgi:hypothetical protein
VMTVFSGSMRRISGWHFALIRQLGHAPQNPSFRVRHSRYRLWSTAIILLQTEQQPQAQSPAGERQFKYCAASSASVHFPTPAGPAKIIAWGNRSCAMARLSISTARPLPMKSLKPAGIFMIVKYVYQIHASSSRLIRVETSSGVLDAGTMLIRCGHFAASSR